MHTKLQIKRHIIFLPFIFSFILPIFLCSSSSAQTQIAPNPNPPGNTISITDMIFNDSDYVNNGTITGVEDSLWYIENRSGGTFSNAGTINIHRSALLGDSMLSLIDRNGGLWSYGLFDNEDTGTINNYHQLCVKSGSTFSNYGYIYNRAAFSVSPSATMNSYGTIVSDGEAGALWIGEDVANYGDIINTNDAYGIIVKSDCTLVNYGTITNQLTMPSARGYSIGGGHKGSGGTIENYGVIDNKVNNQINLTDPIAFANLAGGLLTNAGQIDFGLMMGNSGTVENSGTIIYGDQMLGASNLQNGIIHNTGTFINNATNSADAFGEWNSGTVINDAIFENNGLIENTGMFENNGTFDNRSGTFRNHVVRYYGMIDAGTYQGTGTFIGNLDTGYGTVAPGNSAGTMTVDGDFILSTGGTLEIEIGGFNPGEYDFLDITGTAFLTGGTIDFMFLDGYDISTDIGYGEGLSLMFLDADLGIDSFASTVTYDFLGTPSGFLYDVYRDGTGLWFSATNTNMAPGPGPGPVEVPAPGALALAGIGVGFVNWLRRRWVL